MQAFINAVSQNSDPVLSCNNFNKDPSNKLKELARRARQARTGDMQFAEIGCCKSHDDIIVMRHKYDVIVQLWML